MERVYKTSVPEPSARPLPGKETQVTKGTLDTRPLSSARWQKKKDYPLNNMVQFCFFFFFFTCSRPFCGTAFFLFRNFLDEGSGEANWGRPRMVSQPRETAVGGHWAALGLQGRCCESPGRSSRRRPVHPLHQGPYNRTRWGGHPRGRHQGLCELLPHASLSTLLGTSGPLPRGPMELQVHNKALMAPPTWTLCHTWPPLLRDHFHFDFLLLLLLGAVTVLGGKASKHFISTATFPVPPRWGNQKVMLMTWMSWVTSILRIIVLSFSLMPSPSHSPALQPPNPPHTES